MPRIVPAEIVAVTTPEVSAESALASATVSEEFEGVIASFPSPVVVPAVFKA